MTVAASVRDSLRGDSRVTSATRRGHPRTKGRWATPASRSYGHAGHSPPCRRLDALDRWAGVPGDSCRRLSWGDRSASLAGLKHSENAERARQARRDNPHCVPTSRMKPLCPPATGPAKPVQTAGAIWWRLSTIQQRFTSPYCAEPSRRDPLSTTVVPGADTRWTATKLLNNPASDKGLSWVTPSFFGAVSSWT